MSHAASGRGGSPLINNSGPPPPPSWPTTTAPATAADPNLPLMELEQRITSTRQQLSEVQALLDDLPAIFEQRFLGRLEPLLEQHQRLLCETGELRNHLRDLQCSSGRPLRALPGTTGSEGAAGTASSASAAETTSLRQRLLAALGRSNGGEGRGAA